MDGSNSCANFFGTFHSPNLKCLSIDSTLTKGVRTNFSISSVLRRLPLAESLVDIEIIIRRVGNREAADRFPSEEKFKHVTNFGIKYEVNMGENESLFDFNTTIRSIRIKNCAGSVGKLMEMLANRTLDVEDAADPNDGTCLLITRDKLKGWGLDD